MNSPSYSPVAFERQDNSESAVGYPVELETVLQSMRRGRRPWSSLYTAEHTVFHALRTPEQPVSGPRERQWDAAMLAWSTLYLWAPSQFAVEPFKNHRKAPFSCTAWEKL